MVLAVTKSKVISKICDLWEMFDGDIVVGCLDKVLRFKYLGLETMLSPARGSSAMQKRALATARSYKAGCNRVSTLGPDQIEVAVATWRNLAIPSILYGCESIAFSNTTITEIDRIQASILKQALGLPINAPNIAGQVILGIPSFREVLYRQQLKYFFRLLKQDQGRWSYDALLSHVYGDWPSSYLNYISIII